MSLALAIAAMMLAASTSAWADDLPDPPSPSDRCTVVAKCSSTGMACSIDDSGCKEDARAKGLEVICETKTKAFVYCPPLTGHADSKAIWLLLAAAVTLAVGGTTLAYVLLRKKPDDATSA